MLALPDGGVKLIVQPVIVILDTAKPVGAAGKVVTENGADGTEDPVTVLVVIAVNE